MAMENVSWLGLDDLSAGPQDWLTLEFDDVDCKRLNLLLSLFHRTDGGTGLHVRASEVEELLGQMMPIVATLQNIKRIGAEAAAGKRQEL